MTQRAFVLGHPIEHSISPAIHNAAFRARRLDIQYGALDVVARRLPDVFASLRSPEVIGANVTVPYKEAVLDLVDGVDDVAQAIGAANTIYKRGGELWAANTDAIGFSQALIENRIEAAGRPTVLLGAGGAARAVAHALLSSGVARLCVANRSLERAVLLVDILRQRFPRTELSVRQLSDLATSDLPPHALVVNTTTVGMLSDESPLEQRLLPADGVAVDIIYNPPRTQLLCDAEHAGLRILNGLPMLVQQAAAAWEIWTGSDAPVDVMLAAAERALQSGR